LKYQRIFGSTPQAAQALKEKFGLTGILEVVRMHDPHLNTLALGMDLTALGNMSFPDAFHYNAGTELPPSRREPDYTLPQSYYSSPPHMKQVHLEKYGPETLFYMFYNMPKESTQAIAAQELYRRHWRYHKVDKMWYFWQATEAHWVMFDPHRWDRKFLKQVDDACFMTEEEVRYAPLQG